MELRDYLRILRAHWLGVLLILLAALAATAAYTFTQPKVYAANANGFVGTGAAENPALGSVNDQLAKSRATSYVDIAKSRATATEVAKQLDLDTDPASLVQQIDVQQPEDTVLIKITARDSTPQGAQELADAWVQALAMQVQAIEDPTKSGKDGILRVIPIESAELPSTPISPNPTRNFALGAVAGLLLGLGYALVRNTLDRRLRTPEAVESAFGVSVAGLVPATPALGRKTGERAQLVVEPAAARGREGPASEAFKKLRTNLMFMDVDNPPRVIVVTSPRPSDGKSTVAANLAGAIAMGGQPVVLVDADLRRPTIATSFGVAEGVGLTDVLVGRIDAEDALQRTQEHELLRVLAAGRIPPNPSELLGSRAMRSLVTELSQDALIVLDAPPLLPVTDAAVLTANSDGALIVISAGKTLDTELGTALSHLEAVKGRALGVILNKTPRKGLGGYGDYYGEYYGATTRGGKRKRSGSGKSNGKPGGRSNGKSGQQAPDASAA
ncbi:MAG: polysaccharide biosynthesis tyrosine autokinase [Nocardioides sp.]|uniref:polysaccharide biosynthesis tyrosine autokinase n=1 Tax=Nocardioides sp. TaxID=35761 RepID=UPI0039E55E20